MLRKDRVAYVNNNPLRYTDPSGNQAKANDSEPNCSPNASSPCISEKHGLCLGAWGCSGTIESNLEWIEWNLTEAPPYDWDNFDDDLASIIEDVSGLIGMSDDIQAHWSGKSPSLSFGVWDAIGQFAGDYSRDDLSTGQKIGRAAVVGAEGGVTTLVSNAVGAAVAMEMLPGSVSLAVSTGQGWIPPVAYLSSYAVSYVTISSAMKESWNSVNVRVFSILNLGTP